MPRLGDTDYARYANAFADKEEARIAAIDEAGPVTFLGIRWQIEDGEPTHVGAEWADDWPELYVEATGCDPATDWPFMSAVFRYLGNLHRPEPNSAVAQSFAAIVLARYDEQIRDAAREALL